MANFDTFNQSSSFSFDQMIVNLTRTADSLQSLIIAISYICGIVLIARGLMMYRAFGQHITQTSARGEIAGPMVFILVGAMLIYLPTTLDSSLQTIFDTPLSGTGNVSDMIGYGTISTFARWDELSGVIVKYLKLLGLIAFVRGWIILSKMGHQGAQPGALGKGITHLIGGVLLVNLVDTVNILAETFGFR